ncbi:SpiroCoCo family coiled-coil protein [Leptospira terpstrae]|uniref:SpiroCoCo family coiled-coil protein n=1 Tax=Leptospira terpstrae TaxID=293075 RepID=UPI003D0712DE
MGLEVFLLPFLASVAVTIGLRRLDKSNTKLSQLKRYASKLTDEIHGVALQKIQLVKDAGIDLDILVKQSRKVAEDIQSLSSESRDLFEKIRASKDYLSSLSGEMEQIQDLSTQVRREKQYMEEGLSQINTHKRELREVSEDMESLHNESISMLDNFQNKLNLRSDEILQSVAHKMVELESLLETKSEFLDNSLSKIAETAREKLLSHAEVMVGETAGRLDHARKEMDLLLESMKYAQGELDVRLTKFEDTSSLLSDKVDKFDERLEEKYQRASGKLDEKVNLLDKKIQERFDSIFDQVTHTKDSFMKGLSQETDAIKREIEDLSLETLSKRDDIINETRRQADGINQTIIQFQEKYLEAENKLLRQADIRKQELIREIEAFSEEFHRISEELKEEASSLKKSALQELKDFDRELDTVRSNQETVIKTSLFELRKELEERMHSDFQIQKTEMESDLETVQSQVKDLSESITAQTKDVDEYVEELKSALRESAHEILETAEEKAKESEEIVTEKIRIANANLEQFVSKWEDELGKMRDDQNYSIERLQDRLKEIHVEGADLLGEFQNQFQKAKSNLEMAAESKTKESISKLEDEAKLARSEVDRILKHLEESGESFFNLQEEKMDRLNETIDSKISHQLTKLLDKGNIQLGQLEEKITNHLSTVRRNLEESIKRSKDESKKQIETYQRDYEKSFKEIAKESQDFLIESLERFQDLKYEIGNGLQDLNDTKEETLSSFQSEMETLKEEILTLSSELETVKEHSDLFASAKQIADESNRAVEEISDALQALEKGRPDLDLYQSAISEFSELRKEIASELETLKEAQFQTEDIDKQVQILASNLVHVSETMEGFEQSLTEITSIENRVTKLTIEQSKIESFLSSLQESQDSVFHLVENLETQKHNARELQARLDILDREIEVVEAREKELTETIRQAENRTSFLVEREAQIDSVERKFDKIEELLGDLSDRHRQILTLQKRLEDLKESSRETKDDLESLLGEANETFEKLSEFLDIVQGAMQSPTPAGKSDRKVSGNPLVERKRATIQNLHDNYQWSSEAISEKLNIEKSLVDSILGVRKK